MAKKSTLSAALEGAAGKKTAKPGPVAVATKPTPETVMIGAHFAPNVRQALMMVQVKNGRKMRETLGEAINDLCKKYRVPEPFTEEA